MKSYETGAIGKTREREAKVAKPAHGNGGGNSMFSARGQAPLASPAAGQPVLHQHEVDGKRKEQPKWGHKANSPAYAFRGSHA